MTDQLMGGNAPTPDYMAGVGADTDFGGGMDGNLYPRLAFKSGRFRIRNGEDEIVLKSTEIDVIILKDYPHISRLFFGSGYDPDGENGRPTCASADGVNPLPTVPNPQNGLCATCPQNEKGSNITDDGKKSRACGFFKRLIVKVVGYEDIGPVVADMKAMTLFGESRSSENWWSLKAYFARLKKNGVLPFQIVTKLGFDVDESVPKILFQPTEYVSEHTFINEVAPLISTPDGEQLLLEMVDTSSTRVEGQDDAGAAGNMALPAGEKPAYLDGPKGDVMQETVAAANEVEKAERKSNVVDLPKPDPKPSNLEAALKEALEAGDYASAAEIKAKMEALAAEPPEPKKPSKQEIVDGLKVDLKLAVDSGDYAKAADIQAMISKELGTNTKEAARKEVDQTEEKPLSPQQKAAITRKKNAEKKKRELERLKAQEAEASKAAAVPDAGTEEAESAGVGGDDLDAALAEFGFD